MAVELKTKRADTVFVVQCGILGTHPRPEMPLLAPKINGEDVTAEELGPDCDIDRLISIGAIRPKIYHETPEITELLLESKPFTPSAPPAPATQRADGIRTDGAAALKRG